QELLHDPPPRRRRLDAHGRVRPGRLHLGRAADRSRAVLEPRRHQDPRRRGRRPAHAPDVPHHRERPALTVKGQLTVRRRFVGPFALLAFAVSLATGAAAAERAPWLKVSENQRFLVKEDGSPFFYLGDTAWELFHRLDRNEADRYLRDRAAKGFTVIQAVVLAELDGLHTPNAYGHVPLTNDDPAKPTEDYFRHVDWVVDRANELGLFIGMLPTWGDKWNKGGGVGPEIFTPENSGPYGEWLGRRYKDKGIIWILGGDRNVENDRRRAILANMARGLRSGDCG